MQVGEEGEQWMEDLMGEMTAGSSAMREREIEEESHGRNKGGDGFIRQDAFHPLQDEDYEYDDEEEEEEDDEEEMQIVLEQDAHSYPSTISMPAKPQIYEEEEMEYGEDQSVGSESHDESDEEVESTLLRH